MGSRYSYLAATQIKWLVDETGAKFEWRPILSSKLAVSTDTTPFRWDSERKDWWGARVSGQYKEEYRQQDLSRWASLYGIPYQEPKPPAMDVARRTLFCVAAAILDAGQVYAERMFTSNYDAGAATDETMCRAIATDVGLDAEKVVELIDNETAINTHNVWLQDARAHGVFGVPTFIYGEDLYWGNDRLPLLKVALSR